MSDFITYNIDGTPAISLQDVTPDKLADIVPENSIHPKTLQRKNALYYHFKHHCWQWVLLIVLMLVAALGFIWYSNRNRTIISPAATPRVSCC